MPVTGHPFAHIRTCPIRAYDSYPGCLTAKRWSGHAFGLGYTCGDALEVGVGEVLQRGGFTEAEDRFGCGERMVL